MATETNKQGLLISKALKMGLRVRLRVGGQSMTPSILSRSWIVVRPLDQNEIPRIGDVVMFLSDRAPSPCFVVHRVIWTDGEQITTQGDSNITPDETHHYTKIVGIVVSREFLGMRFMMRPNAWTRWILHHSRPAHKINHLIARLLSRVAGLFPRREEEEDTA